MHPSSLASDFFFFSALTSAGITGASAAEVVEAGVSLSDDGCSVADVETSAADTVLDDVAGSAKALPLTVAGVVGKRLS